MLPRRPALCVCTLTAVSIAAPAQDAAGAATNALVLPATAVAGPMPSLPRLDLELRADGQLSAAGRTVTFDQCVELLQQEARANPAVRARPGPARPALSDLNVVLAADERVPFAAVARLVAACGAETVAAPKVHFAVQRAGGEPGTFAFFLPQMRRGPALAAELHYRDLGSPPSGMAAVGKRVAGRDVGDRVLGLHVTGSVPFGKVLQVLDIAQRGGAPAAALWCDDADPQTRTWNDAATRHDLRALVAASPKPVTNPCLSVEGKRLGEPREVPPAPAGAVGFVDGWWQEGALGLAPALSSVLPPVLAGIDPFAKRRAAGAGSNLGRAQVAAIASALEWLRQHQQKDGRWSAAEFMRQDRDRSAAPTDGAGNRMFDVGVTGLALLAFLAEGTTTQAGAHREELARGLRWLRTQQRENGELGQIVYEHAIATIVFCEAYGMAWDHEWRECAQNALNHLEVRRNPYSVWRYQPRDNDNDTSVTSWCTLAMQTGQLFGLSVNDAAAKLAAVWFDQVTDPNTGEAGYTKMGEGSARLSQDHIARFPVAKGAAMTAAALFSRFALGQDPREHPIMARSADCMGKRPPVWDDRGGSIDEYYWYYGTLAMQQMGGRHWQAWSKALHDALVKSQRKDGNFQGSWDPIGAWGQEGGRVYATALLTLALQTPYRYASFRR